MLQHTKWECAGQEFLLFKIIAHKNGHKSTKRLVTPHFFLGLALISYILIILRVWGISTKRFLNYHHFSYFFYMNMHIFFLIGGAFIREFTIIWIEFQLCCCPYLCFLCIQVILNNILNYVYITMYCFIMDESVSKSIFIQYFHTQKLS